MRENRMLRAMWRGLETGSRSTLTGHEGGNSGYRQGNTYRVTAPALDPTALFHLRLAPQLLLFLGISFRQCLISCLHA